MMYRMARTVKRRYDSSRRQEQSAETRRRIIGAARELFIRRGYGQATIAQIAETAGVAVETVYAQFRNKAALLRQVWFVDLVGDEDEVPLFDRAEMQSILAEPNLRELISKHAAFVTRTNRRMAPLVDVLIGAAASEAGAVRMLTEWAERRVDVATKSARAAVRTGQLTIPEADCRDILYATMDGALWRRLVVERGWSDQRYAEWLAALWTSQFVSRTASRRRGR
jgi:AcrR family transcriptional regulator